MMYDRRAGSQVRTERPMRSTTAKRIFMASLLPVLVVLTLTACIQRRSSLSLEEQQSSSMYLRVPVRGERHSYQAFNAYPAALGEALTFEVPPLASGSQVELGLLRTKSRPSNSLIFRFQASAPGRLGNKSLLVDVEREFFVNKLVTFRLDRSQLGEHGRRAQITLELQAKDDVDRRLSGGSVPTVETSEDEVAFLVPRAFERREAGELNVLLISFDTLRPDHLSSYGYGRPTSPNIDRLASRGVRFTEAISPAPWTMPAHYSLFTALYPSAHQNRWQPERVYRPDMTLARLLRQNGYYTYAVTGGGSVSSEWGMGNGFNVYREYSSYMNTTSPEGPWRVHEDDTAKTFDLAIEWLEKNSHLKFFMFLHHFECHDPYEDRSFLEETIPVELIEQRKALYDGDIRRADALFGVLLEALSDLGLWENTLVILLSDHGDEFNEHYTEADLIPTAPAQSIPEISILDHSHSLYDEVLRVPLIFRIPGIELPKKVIHNQVSLIDVMPTILDIVGIDHPGPMQGASLLPLITTGERRRDPAALSEFTMIGPERKAIRLDGHKYIWVPEPDKPVNKRQTLRGISQFELFDLRSDPGETSNIYTENRDLALTYHSLLVGGLQTSREIAAGLGRDESLWGQRIQLETIDQDVLENLRALGYIE